MIDNRQLDIRAFNPEVIDRILERCQSAPMGILWLNVERAQNNVDAIRFDDDLKTIAKIKLFIAICIATERMQTAEEDIGSWTNDLAYGWLPSDEEYQRRFTEWLISRQYNQD